MKGFPNHVIFYIAHEHAIEVVRILHERETSTQNFEIHNSAARHARWRRHSRRWLARGAPTLD